MSEEVAQNIIIEDVSEKQTPQLTPEQEAVLYIQQGTKLFDQMVQNVSGVQAKRILEAVVKSPFEEISKQLTTKEAAMLYELCDRIQSKKFVLFQMSLEQQMMDAMNAEEGGEQSGADTTVNNNEETKGN
jgi:hypothetical protein